MHEELKAKMSELKALKEQLVSMVKQEICGNAEKADVKEVGEVVDMIKDLAEAEKYCWEGCYYESVSTAMEEHAEEPEEMYGYNRSRSPRTGRYTSGRGQMGYTPRWPNDDWPIYPMEMMGYDGGNRGGSMGGNTSGNGNMGYKETVYPDRRYGEMYDRYRMAKRHYTETHSPEDKQQMSMHAKNHLNETFETIRDIWADADPELRKKMKMDLVTMTNELQA